MKDLGIKYIIVYSLLLLVTTTNKAQYVDITINPLSALTGTAVVMAELPIHHAISIELQSAHFFEAQRFWTPNYRTKGYRVGALTHLYLNRDLKHTEFSVLAYVRYLDVRYESIEEVNTLFDRDSYNLSQAAVGFGASYKKIFGEHFVMSLGGGMGRNFARRLKRDQGQTGDFFSLGFQANADFDIYARLTLGYRLRYSIE